MKTFFRYAAVTAALAVFLVPAFSQAQSVESLQAQIQALLRQLEQLQEQIQKLQAGGTNAPGLDVAATARWCHLFEKNLRIGERGAEIQALHEALEREGFSVGNDRSEGVFGEATASAVTRLQEKYGDEVLAPLGLGSGTGFAGPGTRSVLNRLYRCGELVPPPQTDPLPLPTDVIRVRLGYDFLLDTDQTAIVEDYRGARITFLGLSWPTTSDVPLDSDIIAGSPWATVSVSIPNSLVAPERIMIPLGGKRTVQGLTIEFLRTDGNRGVFRTSADPSQELEYVDLKVDGSDGPLTRRPGYAEFGWTSSKGTVSCSASGDTMWSGAKRTNGSEKVWVGNEKTGTTTYRIDCANDKGVTLSDSVMVTFDYSTSSLTVISPNGREDWPLGSTQFIKWTSPDRPASLSSAATGMRIELVGAEIVCIAYPCPLVAPSERTYIIANHTADVGYYAWRVGTVVTSVTVPQGRYRVRITDLLTGASDMSDGTFLITNDSLPGDPFPGRVTVLSPNGGETFVGGQTHDATWRSEGIVRVNIYLCYYGWQTNVFAEQCKFLAAETGSTGRFSWWIDPNHPYIPGNMKIKVTNAAAEGIYDLSDGTFTILETSGGPDR